MQLGGAPVCTGCSKAVYHVEQVMGPGRRIYHKMCLKCTHCQKRVDQGGLVEHDGDPYCLRCHTQLFGTRDLRHGNVRPSPSPAKTPSRPPNGSLQGTPTPMSPPTSSRPLPRPPVPTDFYTPPRPEDAVPFSATPTSPRDPSTPITRPNFRDPRPISVPYAGGVKALDERGLLRRAESPRSKVGERVLGDDACWGCEKRVYMAEQVNAIGHKWHRGCLRCIVCKTTVDPSKISDRDGQVYCKNCYGKQHGPGGLMR